MYNYFINDKLITNENKKQELSIREENIKNKQKQRMYKLNEKYNNKIKKFIYDVSKFK